MKRKRGIIVDGKAYYEEEVGKKCEPTANEDFLMNERLIPLRPSRKPLIPSVHLNQAVALLKEWTTSGWKDFIEDKPSLLHKTTKKFIEEMEKI